ncbi:MAG: BrnT family toxin [Desulfovibrio sp.]|jgi:uncharacterized DUF497 family protein|nr:BrnT family toxin [Desulfovibrio sp.]
MENNEYEWDDAENNNNMDKHNVSFETAIEIFYDSDYVHRPKGFVSGFGQRIAIGKTHQGTLVTLAYCLPPYNKSFRTKLLSARKSSNTERRIYEKHCQPID